MKRTQRQSRRLLIQSLEGRRMLAAGPYAPAAGELGSTAIKNTDPAFVGWASAVADYSPGSDVDDVWTDATNALGPAEGNYDSIVSLGRGGAITLTFDAPIRDGLGADFAVFENSINDTFLELGFVEVSSDGVNYFRFAADSKTPSAVASFGAVDPTNIHNLAGKYRGGFGTPFDLAELRDQAGLDVTAVKYVRLVDIVGDGLTRDATGDSIYDPTPTFQSAGLDVDGVGVIHAVETGPGVIDFETLGGGLGPSQFDNGASGAGQFSEDELSLNNDYSTAYQSWSGWSISQTTDTTTAGYTNQYANITGGGVDDSDTFAVGFFDSSPSDALTPPTMTLDPATGASFDSLYVTNTTYAVLSMQQGDGFAKKFGGVTGNDPDYLRLTITGVDASGTPVGDVKVMLADYRPADNTQDFIVDTWTPVDVSSLSDAQSLQFTLDSTDNSPFGMNTPAYFAVDNVTLRRPAVPLDLASPITTEDNSVIGRVSRPSLDSSTELTVSLTRTGSDQATLPDAVTIPAGADYAEFSITPVNDAVPTPDRELQVTASADLFVPTTRSLLIQDDEVLSIHFTPSIVNATEGAGPSGASLTLTRNDADVSTPLTVTLTHDATDLLSIPTTATFASTQRTITIPVDVLDDDIASSGQTVHVQAAASGRASAQLTIELADDDLPRLQIDPTFIQLSENEPSTIRTVRLYRNTADRANPVTVSLSLPSGGPLTIPSEVTIAADADFVSFDVGVIDDSLVNTMSEYPILVSSSSFLSASLRVTVTDNDGPPPSLGITFPDGGLSESDAVFISDFESLGAGLLSGEFENNAGSADGFSDGTLQFENSFDQSFGFDVWSGFAISRGTDTHTPGFGNQYSSIAGGGSEGSSTYAVAYASAPVTVRRPSNSTPFSSMDVSNTTYAALSMRDGDDFAKKFGGESGNDPDFLLLTVDGLDADGNSIGEVQVYLADYRFNDNDLDYILEDWSTIDISSIGTAETLSIQLSSSDNGDFGMNTPGYFALDNVLLEPASPSLPTITITRTGDDVATPLEVSVVDDRSELRLPSRVTIPAGVAQISIPVIWLDDNVAEGDRTWQVAVTATGYTGDSQTVTLHDDDENTLSITPSVDEVSESAGRQTVGFEEIGESLQDDAFNNGSDGRGGFQSGSVQFPTAYNATYGSWSGWAASNVGDVATAGFTNQFSAFANIESDHPGGGAADSATFAVAGGYGSSPLTISLPNGLDGSSFASISVTNTTYTALSMLQGDDFAKRFGGETGDAPDYFLLTIDGVDDAGDVINTIEFYLADYRFADNSLDYVVDDWTTIDLSTLAGATSLRFGMSSSDVGDFGMNTPAYFAIDDLVIDRTNDAPPSLMIARNSGDLSEDVTVTLNASPAFPLITPSSVVIPAGLDRVRVPLNLIDDAVYSGDQTVDFSASASGFADVIASIDVLEDELPSIVLTDATDNISVVEGGPENSFMVQLPSAPSGPVTVLITGGEDSLDVSARELTFGPDDWNQPQVVTVSGRLDLLAEADQVIQLQVSGSSGDYAAADAWVQLADYQPAQLTLKRVGDQVELVDDVRDYVFGEFTDDDPIAISLSDLSQQFTLEPVGRDGVTVSLGGGDDQLLLNSAIFTQINGGGGQDKAVLTPTDLNVDESIDVADWLSDRIIGFEHVVLGSETIGADTASISFTLDADRMQTMFTDDSPFLITTSDQNLALVGDWRIGEPTIADGEFTGRMVSGAADVWVVTDRPYQNFVQHADVNADGLVSSVDALTIINRINADAEFILPPPTSTADFAGIYYDVSGDGLVTSLDALQVINWLNENDIAAGSDTVTAAPTNANRESLHGWSAQRDQTWSDIDRANISSTQTSPMENTMLPASTVRPRPPMQQVAPVKPIDPAAADMAIADLDLLTDSLATFTAERFR
ncbi:DUF4465 domain-containing protein [Allorhodopirellula heiligendammensis]|nr:DUF4465 domain-containing protein [Allorhodopirellula heiligendammensis]